MNTGMQDACNLAWKLALVSRGLAAQFDCSDAKRDLDWHPVQDRAAFIAMAVDVHRTPFERQP